MSTQLLVFKNNLPNVTVLKLFSQDIEALQAKLKQKLKQAPMMFIGMQLVLDISAFDREGVLSLDIETLLDFLRGEGINPVALMSDKAAFREKAIASGIGALPTLQSTARQDQEKSAQPSSTQTLENVESNASVDAKAPEPAKQQTSNEQHDSDEPRKTFDETPPMPEAPATTNQIIRQPVRSGQRIYARGDLTVIGAVSPGAEIIADGSIHVYGKLSGRAIAGAQGDESAAIFCQQLNAELVSIAGNYKQLEDIDSVYRNQRVQISLENEKICFFSL